MESGVSAKMKDIDPDDYIKDKLKFAKANEIPPDYVEDIDYDEEMIELDEMIDRIANELKPMEDGEK